LKDLKIEGTTIFQSRGSVVCREIYFEIFYEFLLIFSQKIL